MKGFLDQIAQNIVGKHDRAIRDAEPILQPDQISPVQMSTQGRLTLGVTMDQFINHRSLNSTSEPETEHEAFPTRHDRRRFIDVDDWRQPRSIQPVIQSGEISISNASKIPGRRGTDRQPVAFLPIDQIVKAFLTRPSPVADLVMLESFGSQALAGAVEHRRFDRVVDRVDASQTLLLRQWRSGLEDQTVAREMVGLEGKYRIEISIPIFHGRAWDTKNQVETDPLDPCSPKAFNRDRDAVGIVPTLECLEQVRLKTLATKADAVDAPPDQCLGDRFAHRFWVCLDRKLFQAACGDRSDRRQNPSKDGRFQKRRRAAPDKGGSDLRPVDRAPNRLRLKFKSIGEGLGSITLIYQGVEIAIVALMPAEWNVGVERVRARRVDDAGGSGQTGAVVVLREFNGGRGHPVIVFTATPAAWPHPELMPFQRLLVGELRSGGVDHWFALRAKVSGKRRISHHRNPNVRHAGSTSHQLTPSVARNRENPLAAEIRAHDSDYLGFTHRETPPRLPDARRTGADLLGSSGARCLH